MKNANDNDFLQTRLDDTTLNYATAVILMREDIITVGDLLKLRRYQLKQLPGIAKLRIGYIEAMLREKGYRLLP